MSENILEIRDLAVEFLSGEQRQRVVEGVSFDIRQGETLALVGESGSGKSVTAHSILRLLPYSVASHPAGSIHYQGEDLLKLPERRLRGIRGNRIAMVFQEPMTSLNPLHTIEKQLAEVLALHKGLGGAKASARILELLELVGIPEPAKRLKAYPHELSGGQRQRVMIAMALACEPQLLIADEPTTALDVTVQLKILDLLKDLQARLGMSLLLITHDLNLVRRIAHRVCVMQQGRIVEQASCQELFAAPRHPYTRELLNAEPSGAPASNPPGETLLAVDDLRVWFPIRKGVFRRTVDHVKAVDGVNFELPRGQTLGIVGESGSGKSTLGLAILRLLESQGGIRFEGTRLDGLAQHDVRRCAARCRWCSRTRMAASAHACVSARSSAKACASIGSAARPNRSRRSSTRWWRSGSIRRPATVTPRILRRPAPAHRHRPGTGAETGTDPARRTDLGARPHRAAPSRGITAATAGQVQPHLPVHQPRPGGSQGAQPPADGGSTWQGSGTGQRRSGFASPQHPYTQQLLEAAFMAPASAEN